MISLETLQESEWIILEATSGSHAYGLATATSDVDIRGVFVLPRERYYGLEYTPQISDATNDTVYYELGRFMELLSKSNPNLLELLSVPERCLRKRHPLMEKIDPKLFLSKQAIQTITGYALTQVRKARGLNKKIVNPMSKEKKSLLDFCYVAHGQGSMPLKHWLQKQNWQQEDVGLAKIPHMKNMYALFHQAGGLFKGVISGPDADQVSLSSIPKGMDALATVSCNEEGYSTYCKEYKEYWHWVDHRNDARYAQTVNHGRNYDSKNMMHTFRLLAMAEEIAREGLLRVERPDREELLAIRAGEFEYDELVIRADQKISEIQALTERCALPAQPDQAAINDLLVSLRTSFYHEK